MTEFNQLIAEILSPLRVVVKGELSEVKINQGRWLFATLKDNQASVPVFSYLDKIANWQVLQDGMRVWISGQPRLHQKSGKFSLFAWSITPAGRGALKEALEKLKKELESLGYFDLGRKRSLPLFIGRVGLITAPGSRAYSDFITALNKFSSGVKVDFYPVLVQGNQAINRIRQAFDFFNRRSGRYDLLVLTRGGGSLEDLLPFNSRAMAEIVYGSQVPVLAAIGHEEDDCLIDMVADVRAATPNAAAERINSHHQELLLTIDRLAEKTAGVYEEKILAEKELLNNLVGNFFVYYQQQFQQADFLFTRLDGAADRLYRQIVFKKETLSGLVKLLTSFDYRNILRRGFTLTLGDHGKIITTPRQVIAGDEITTRFYRGEIISRVKQKND